MRPFPPILLVLLSTVAAAFSQAPAPAKKLSIVANPAAPFVSEKNGVLSGLDIDLWHRIALEMQLPFEVKAVANVPAALAAVADGSADVAIGAISITADREKSGDFSHPYFQSGLQILAPARSQGSVFAAFKGLLKMDTLKVIGVLLLALFLNSHLLWWLERRKNPEAFPPQYARGVFETTWWSVSTLITGGCENLAPIGVGGRLCGVVWMLGSIGLTAYITATLASTMTVNTLTSDIKDLGDLQGKTVATKVGSSAESFLKSHGLPPQTFGTIDDACGALASGKVDAVVFDAPLLRYYLSTHAGTKLQLVGTLFEKQHYGFALPEGSPYRKQINRALLQLDEEGYFEELDRKWFPEPKASGTD